MVRFLKWLLFSTSQAVIPKPPAEYIAARARNFPVSDTEMCWRVTDGPDGYFYANAREECEKVVAARGGVISRCPRPIGCGEWLDGE